MKFSKSNFTIQIPVRVWMLVIVFAALVINIGLFRSNAAPKGDRQGPQLKAQIYAFPKEELLPGTKQSYSLIVTNTGSQTITGVRVRATVPATLEMLHVTDGKYDNAASNAVWNIGKMGAGQSVTVSFMGRLASTARAGEKFEVQLFAAGDGLSEVCYGSLITQVSLLPEGPKANITTFQTVSTSTPSPGDEALFHVIVHNEGQALAQGVVISEKLPVGLELLPDTIHPHLTNFAASTEPTFSYDASNGLMQVKVDNLMPNEWVALMFSARINKEVNIGTRIKAEALIEVQVPQLHTTAPVEFQTVAANAAAGFTVSVSSDKSNAAVGDKLIYTITVTNNKPQAVNKLKITNKIPAELSLVSGSSTTSCGLKIVEAGDKGQVLWKKGTLPSSGSCVVSFKATVASAGSGTITNTATAKAPGSGMTSASAQTMVAAPSVAKVDIMDNFFAPNMLTVSAGTTVSWTNQGNGIHTVTGASCNALTFVASDGQFPSGLRKGDSYTYTIPADAKSGAVFYYFCRFHGSPGNCTSLGPGMAGMIVVK